MLESKNANAVKILPTPIYDKATADKVKASFYYEPSMGKQILSEVESNPNAFFEHMKNDFFAGQAQETIAQKRQTIKVRAIKEELSFFKTLNDLQTRICNCFKHCSEEIKRSLSGILVRVVRKCHSFEFTPRIEYTFDADDMIVLIHKLK